MLMESTVVLKETTNSVEQEQTTVGTVCDAVAVRHDGML